MSDNGSLAHHIVCVPAHSLKKPWFLEHLSQPFCCFYYQMSCLMLSNVCEEVQWSEVKGQQLRRWQLRFSQLHLFE